MRHDPLLKQKFPGGEEAPLSFGDAHTLRPTGRHFSGANGCSLRKKLLGKRLQNTNLRNGNPPSYGGLPSPLPRRRAISSTSNLSLLSVLTLLYCFPGQNLKTPIMKGENYHSDDWHNPPPLFSVGPTPFSFLNLKTAQNHGTYLKFLHLNSTKGYFWK